MNKNKNKTIINNKNVINICADKIRAKKRSKRQSQTINRPPFYSHFPAPIQSPQLLGGFVNSTNLDDQSRRVRFLDAMRDPNSTKSPYSIFDTGSNTFKREGNAHGHFQEEETAPHIQQDDYFSDARDLAVEPRTDDNLTLFNEYEDEIERQKFNDLMRSLPQDNASEDGDLPLALSRSYHASSPEIVVKTRNKLPQTTTDDPESVFSVPRQIIVPQGLTSFERLYGNSDQPSPFKSISFGVSPFKNNDDGTDQPLALTSLNVDDELTESRAKKFQKVIREKEKEASTFQRISGLPSSPLPPIKSQIPEKLEDEEQIESEEQKKLRQKEEMIESRKLLAQQLETENELLTKFKTITAELKKLEGQKLNRDDPVRDQLKDLFKDPQFKKMSGNSNVSIGNFKDITKILSFLDSNSKQINKKIKQITDSNIDDQKLVIRPTKATIHTLPSETTKIGGGAMVTRFRS